MKRNQLVKVREVHRGAILRHSDCGRSMIIVVKTNPRSTDDGRSFQFQAQDLSNFQIHEFSAAYPLQPYHPHLEYIGEAAN